MRLGAVATLLLAVAVIEPAIGGWRGAIGTDAGSGVDAEVESPFDTAPPSGFLPVRVRIKNLSGSEREWTADLSSTGGIYNNRSTLTATDRIRVGNGQVREVDLLVPISSFRWSYSPSVIQLSGYGMEGRPTYCPTQNQNSNATGFIGMSKKLAVRSWEPLKDLMSKDHPELRGSMVDLSLMGEDWRGFLGLSSLWLTDEEYQAMAPTQRLALRDWLLQGGEVFMCSENSATAPRGDFGANTVDGRATFGLGVVHFLSWNGRELPAGDVAQTIEAHDKAKSAGSQYSYDQSWPPNRYVDQIKWNIPVLSAGILAFAICVGPLNLFWFARSGRRQRLFWTTPLISVIASVAFGLLIVFQEGFGGVGARVLLVYLDSPGKRQVLLQEQVSKTGVLLQTRFAVGDIGLLVPLAFSNDREQRRNATYSVGGGQYSGDWFSTRWRQIQFAEAILPSRAEIRLTNGGLAAQGQAPEILSSIPASLKLLFLRDVDGRCWMGENVHPGQKIALRPADDASLQAMVSKFPAGDQLKIAMKSLQGRRDFFYATADEGDFLPTLSSVRWNRNSALYCGPLVGGTLSALP